VVDISSENPIVLKKTNIRAAKEPYYLDKRHMFICYDEHYHRVHICNLQGDILATLGDHPMINSNLMSCSYITNSQDMIISVCSTQDRFFYTINVSSILSGKCLEKISVNIPNCSEIRYAALTYLISEQFRFTNEIVGFAYDERTHEIFTANDDGICCVWSNKFYNDVGDIIYYPGSEDE
jgi:hypothetical protein